MSFKLICRSVLLAGLLSASAAAIALAAHPIKGATYKGSWGPKVNNAKVQFKVSHSGKRVSTFNISSAPIGCQGVEPQVKLGGSGSISKQGKFRVVLPTYFPPTQPSRHVGTLVVTGTFGKHGRESGKLASKFSGKNGFRPTCDTTVKYSTKG